MGGNGLCAFTVHRECGKEFWNSLKNLSCRGSLAKPHGVASRLMTVPVTTAVLATSPFWYMRDAMQGMRRQKDGGEGSLITHQRETVPLYRK